MVEQQLIDYVKKARDAGQQDFQTRSLLLKNGWSNSEIDEAFAAANSTTPQNQSKPQIQPQTQQQSPNQPQQTFSQPQQTISQQQNYPQTSQQKFQPSYQSSIDMKKSGNSVGKLLLAIFTVLIIISLLGGGGFAYVLYSGIYNPEWNPFNVPKKIIFDDIISGVKDIKSYKLETTGKITLKDNISGNQTFLGISSQSDVNLTDENLPKTSSLFNIYSKADANTPLVSINANTISLGSDLYVKINEWIADEKGIPNLENFQNQGWLKYDQESSEFLKSNEYTKIEPIIELARGTNLLPQNLADLKSWFLVREQLKDEVIDGQEVYRFLGVVEKNNLNLEIWVRKNDSMIYGYKLTKALDQNIIFDITGRIYDLNNPSDITAPEETKKIEDIIRPMITVKKIESDLKNIWTVAQTTKQNTEEYTELCYKGLLNGYLEGSGDYLIELNNNIIEQGAKKPICLSSADNFCISTELPDKTFMCVDKNGIIGTTKCVSSATECQ